MNYSAGTPYSGSSAPGYVSPQPYGSPVPITRPEKKSFFGFGSKSSNKESKGGNLAFVFPPETYVVPQNYNQTVITPAQHQAGLALIHTQPVPPLLVVPPGATTPLMNTPNKGKRSKKNELFRPFSLVAETSPLLAPLKQGNNLYAGQAVMQAPAQQYMQPQAAPQQFVQATPQKFVQGTPQKFVQTTPQKFPQPQPLPGGNFVTTNASGGYFASPHPSNSHFVVPTPAQAVTSSHYTSEQVYTML